ncbi:MAG: acyl--CoA ligase [Planctomycetes bacterium]|nr:acyl--CoA ligase [Planctomycetota bacterium]
MHGPLIGRNNIASEPAAPILTALRSYRGEIIDLEEGITVGGIELGVSAEAVSHWVADIGLAAGDRVVFSVGNGPAFTAALCGVLAAGGSPIVLHGDTPPQELQRFAQQYSARFVLSQRPIGEPLGQGDGCLGQVERRPSDASALPEWLNLHCTELPLDPLGPTFPSLPGTPLHPTSGTTGRAKIAVRTAQQAVEEARHYIDTMQITSQDRILCVVPMSHAYGFGMGFMVSLLSGARLVTLRQFNPRTIARVLAEQQITIFPAAPAMLDLVVRAAPEGITMPRLVLAAGAPLTEGTAAAFRNQTGTRVTSLYGTTETGGITVAVGEVDDLPGGCVGRPMQGVEAMVAPIADAAELAPGVGRVLIRSSSMMSGYLTPLESSLQAAPSAQQQAKACTPTPQGIDNSAISDGWFETGDLGRLDPQGRIQLVGREKEIINVFGMKVVPSEVEEVISAMPGVREVKVYAGTHRSGSELVKAAVAVDGELDVSQIREYCELNLAPYKRPQVIQLVEALPRSPMGKILRDQLP